MLDSSDMIDTIGDAPAFLQALAHASAAAPLDRPLLIWGERGSGKELFASRIHFLSKRWEGPLVKVNCAALSETLLETELFGHEAGAFTGAQKRHIGRFERAAGGTLFLDEIPSASLRVQEKLLRVIEYGEFERIGGETTLKADVRVIGAANVNLPELAAKGEFRADLLDRLAFDVIRVPPLRERPEDIPALAAHFASGMAHEIDAPYHGFTPEAVAALMAHSWPGNVRELKNVAERSFYQWIATENSGPVNFVSIDPFSAHEASLNEITSAATPDSSFRKSGHADNETQPVKFDLRKRLDKIEKQAAKDALNATRGNQKEAAKLLSLTYDQMRGLVRKHRLSTS